MRDSLERNKKGPPMNDAYLHLIVNHFPASLPLIAIPVALYGSARQRPPLQQLGLGLLVLAGVFAGLSYLTGGGAADVLEKDPTVVRDSIDTHVMAADWAL